MKPFKPLFFLLAKKPLLIIAFCMLQLAACTKINLYEKVVAVPGQAWQSSYKPSFTFEISDTTAPYQLFFILRHNNRYGYNNIWLNVHRQSPDGKTSTVPYELQLATNEKGWLAEGMDDLYAHRIPLTPPANDTFYFNRAGKYTFTIEQTMREDPLQHVMNVGLRIEKK
ncbi:MAG: gliding motility lipoprotein GldH [Chitinophagaceae bacterium]